MTAKKCTQKRDAYTKLLFCLINLLLFCCSRFRRCQRCFSSLISRGSHPQVLPPTHAWASQKSAHPVSQLHTLHFCFCFFRFKGLPPIYLKFFIRSQEKLRSNASNLLLVIIQLCYSYKENRSYYSPAKLSLRKEEYYGSIFLNGLKDWRAPY